MENQKSLYLSDFMTGLLAALTLRQVFVLSLRNHKLDHAVGKLFADLTDEAEQQGLNLRFRIRPHPVHNDSVLIQQALYEAAQRDLISLDNPEFQDIRLKISIDDATSYFDNIVGSRDMYSRLAERFIQYYQENSTL